jgi:THO complex subunit 5
MASKQLTAVLGKIRDQIPILESASKDDKKFQAVATDASLMFLELKATNRDVLEGIEATREQTSGAKKELDDTRLQLQNVLYEKSHIQKEIKTCQDFRSKYTDEAIGLCGVAAFKASASAEVQGEADGHTLVGVATFDHVILQSRDTS